MNKKLLVLAVSSALAGTAAQADTANVNVYGRLYPQYQVDSAHGASTTGNIPSTLGGSAGSDNASKHRVESTNSNIGFKGDADVGGGMKGWFQVEQSIQLDTGTGTFSSRNSAAGLSGKFGNVFLGRWDTIYKQLGDPVSFLGISSGNFVATSNTLASQSGFGTNSAGSFHLRRSNWIEYDTPTFGGWQVMLGYGPDETRSSGSPAQPRNAYVRDIGVKWESGPIYVALAHEYHNDFFGGSLNSPSALSNFNTVGANSKDQSLRLSFKIALPSKTELGFDLSQIEYKESGQAAAGRFQSYERNAASFVVLQKLGNLSLAGALVKAEDGDCTLSGGTTCTTAGLGATQISLGARYDFSKRVGIFAIAAKIKNDPSARYSLTDNVAPGADPEALAAGVIVSF